MNMGISSAYLFLEISLLVFLLGFGWEVLRPRQTFSRPVLLSACGLAGFWFLIDQVAIVLGLWTFPSEQGGTLPVRVFSLPIEEYLLFFFHTLVCAVFLNHYLEVADR
jgi:lycopene cyclase domain-containing protein